VEELCTRRACSFGLAAREYALHRPGYPKRAVLWSLQPLRSTPTGAAGGGSVRTGAPLVRCRVLDLAAGTGKLTEALLRCGVPASAVLAVEPDAAMRAELCRQLPQVSAVAGTAERIPAGTGTLDAVLVGQAFHWFEPDRALAEIARVLRPGGVLALLGSVEDDSVRWVAELIVASQARQAAGNAGRGFAELPVHPAFAAPVRRRFRWRWPRTIDSLLQTVGTYSWALISEPHQRDIALAEIRDYLQRHPVSRGGAFELPMQTLVVRTVRTVHTSTR
jgi:SAM-dependent methyltransferase